MPKYVVKKSIVAAITVPRILFCWLIIPLIFMIVDMVQRAFVSIECFDNHIVYHNGVLSKNEHQCIFTGVQSVTVHQSLWGRIFNYGDVQVDVRGQWDINTTQIKDPYKFKEYLQQYIIDADKISFFSGV